MAVLFTQGNGNNFPSMINIKKNRLLDERENSYSKIAIKNGENMFWQEPKPNE